MKFLVLFSAVLLLLLQSRELLALNNGLARTPPMGWLVWERYACNTDCANDPDNCISEKLFKDMADHLASDGFKELGYEFVNIDDCWASKMRDANGTLQADPIRFPSGIKALAEYVHSKGLKLGIYGDLGTHTCGGYPGSLGYIEKDAQTFAEWNVDMLKLDGCYSSPADYDTGYPNMSKALLETRRPIVFSCSWPAYIKNPNYTKIAETCNLWRNYDDINDSWDSVLGIITHYGANQDQFQPFAAPGQWNDPDMLIIGDFGLSLDQQKAQMAIWAIFAAPLFMSNDLRKLSDESKAILQNKEVIAINQDKLGKQGRLISSSVEQPAPPGHRSPAVTSMVFARPLDGGDLAIAMLNTGHFSGPRNTTVSFKDAGVSWSKASVRDVMAGKDLGVYSESFTAPVDPTGVRLVRLTPAN